MRGVVYFGSKRIAYTVAFTQRKSLRIQVHQDEQVYVLAPVDAAPEEVAQKVKAKALWILKQLDFFNSFKPRTTLRRYISGETHLYLGRQYRLKVVESENRAVKAYRGQLFVSIPNSDAGGVAEQIESWYTERAQTIIAELLREVLPQFRKYGIKEPRITVRKMQKRWGSCTPQGRIILNTELVKAPKSCIEYVLVHELCHLVHFNHKRDFFCLLAQKMPDWATRKERLEYLLV